MKTVVILVHFLHSEFHNRMKELIDETKNSFSIYANENGSSCFEKYSAKQRLITLIKDTQGLDE